MITGNVLRLGDDVNTDVIIPARYMQNYDALGAHVFAGEGPEIAARANASTFVVGGKNFGCGSSREQAVMAIQQAGIKCVLAPSFARIFYRNAVNLALPILEVDADIPDNAEIEVDIATGKVREPSTGREWQARPPPPEVQAILNDGGLIPHMKRRLGTDTDA